MRAYTDLTTPCLDLVSVDPPRRRDHLGPPGPAPANGHAARLFQGQR